MYDTNKCYLQFYVVMYDFVRVPWRRWGFSSFQLIPILVGVIVIGVTAVIAKIFIFSKKKKAPVTLVDASIKYPLKLVDKEVSGGRGGGQVPYST